MTHAGWWIFGGLVVLGGAAFGARAAYSAGAAPEPPLTEGEKALLQKSGIVWSAPNTPEPADTVGKVLVDRSLIESLEKKGSLTKDEGREIHDLALSLGGPLRGSVRAGKLAIHGWRFWQPPSAALPLTVRLSDPAPAAPAKSPPTAPVQADDPIVAPAYAFLDLWDPASRRALFDLQKELGLDPRVGGLAGVIGHESNGDPAAPIQKSGTPRGGLIQVTVNANMPGYTSKDAVWAIRNQGRVQQLRGVVRDFYKIQLAKGPPADQGAVTLLRRNYLPALAGRPASTVLGVRPGRTGPGGEKPESKLAGDLTYGRNYESNPGFDPAGRGWFTWEDVDRQAAQAERAARARGWVRVSGARVPPGDPSVAGLYLMIRRIQGENGPIPGTVEISRDEGKTWSKAVATADFKDLEMAGVTIAPPSFEDVPLPGSSLWT